MEQIKEIIVLFKTHLDIGYTDLAEKVTEQYEHSYIPKALQVARELRERGGAERFVWTAGSWLIDHYLRTAAPERREEMIRGIRAGDTSWHGLPFTTHTELMDEMLFRHGLELAQDLDRTFGRRTIAAKMTDVPGHTRAIVPYMAEAGIEFLHIGVNPVSVSPRVPPLFRWRSPEGAELAVMYNAGYGRYTVIPGTGKAMMFAHTGDNNGPQSADSIRDTYRRLREEHPDAVIRAGDLNDIALAVREIRDALPVVEDEIGDTWIHGAQSDPGKIAVYRELLRVRRQWSEEDRRRIDRELLYIPEHTWGLDYKAHLRDHDHYVRTEFERVRETEPYRRMERSWEEQREYLQAAVRSVEGEPRRQAERALEIYRKDSIDRSRYRRVDDPSAVVTAGRIAVRFDPDGAISHLTLDGGEPLADRDRRIGLFKYEAFSRKEQDLFFSQYCDLETFPELKHLAVDDFIKVGAEAAISAYASYGAELAAVYENGEEIVAVLAVRSEAAALYGCPAELELAVSAQKAGRVLLDLSWRDKPASRVAEAIWFGMNPIRSGPCRIGKLGAWIDPGQVVPFGNKRLHGTDRGVRFDDLGIETLDTALVNVGEPSLCDFNDRDPDLSAGLYFNLYNNVWNTNFPLWYGGDARFRFVLDAAK